MKKKKGFTLIELMIVIAMVAILAQVMIPKVGAVKVQMKNNSVQTNAKLVRAFLENRSSKDANSIKTYIANHTGDITGALSLVKTNLGTAMTKEFTFSNKMTNPFNQSISIISDQTSVSLYGSAAASIVVGYDATDTLPVNEAYVTSDLPQGSTFMGEVAVVVYQTGFVVYGIDDQGNKADISIIKMPNGLIVGNITTPGTPVTPTPNINDSILSNIDRVYNFLAINAASKIIIDKGTGNQFNQLLGQSSSLFVSELTGYFVSNVPKTSQTYNAIENPMDTSYNNVIGPIVGGNNYLSSKYSVLVWGDATTGWSIEPNAFDFSLYKGTVVASVNGINQTGSDQLGYDVFGIAADGSKIGDRHLDMQTLMNGTTENALSSNVKIVQDYLQANLTIYGSKNWVKYNKIGALDENLINDLKLNFSSSKALVNPYVNTWNAVGYQNSLNFYPSYSLLLTKDTEGDFSKYNGTIIIKALPGQGNTLGGFEVYGINYNGDPLADKTIMIIQ